MPLLSCPSNRHLRQPLTYTCIAGRLLQLSSLRLCLPSTAKLLPLRCSCVKQCQRQAHANVPSFLCMYPPGALTTGRCQVTSTAGGSYTSNGAAPENACCCCAHERRGCASPAAASRRACHSLWRTRGRSSFVSVFVCWPGPSSAAVVQALVQRLMSLAP